MSNPNQQLREELVQAMRNMENEKLNTKTSGNASARVENGLLITPSGIPATKLHPKDIVQIDLKGNPQQGQQRPSSEWQCHAQILAKRPELGAVVHAHSPYATALACKHQGIPAFHYMVAITGDTHIPCAPYATFGTKEFAEAATKTIKGRNACLLANHGLLATAEELAQALHLLQEVEWLAKQYWLTLQTPGKPILLSEKQMQEVLKRFQNYGPQR